jgi:hypothetical protein
MVFLSIAVPARTASPNLVLRNNATRDVEYMDRCGNRDRAGRGGYQAANFGRV